MDKGRGNRDPAEQLMRRYFANYEYTEWKALWKVNGKLARLLHGEREAVPEREL